MTMVANKKAPAQGIAEARGKVVAGADYDGNRRGVQGQCANCALFIPRKSAHGRDKCRWCGEVLTASAMPLAHCAGHTAEVVCDD